MNRVLYGFHGDLGSFAGLGPTEQVALLQERGCNAVFGGYDDAGFVRAARTAGLPIYAEYGGFCGEHWWREVPASHPIKADGQPLAGDDWYYGVNPSEPTVRVRLLEGLERLLNESPVDGVWLDFIRWPCHWEAPDPERPATSFDRGTLARFSADSGIALPEGAQAAAEVLLGPCREVWYAWRCAQVTDWVRQARELLDRLRPGVLLGMFTIPWRRDDFDGALRRVVGQDLAGLSAYVDVFSPMVYHLMCGQEPTWIAQVSADVRAQTGCPVWPIVQSVDKPTPLLAEAYGAALDAAMGCDDTDGVIVFTLEGMLTEPKIAITRSRWAEG